MKSLLFKSAWSIAKIKGISFSEALTIAWKAVKNDVKIVVNTAWNGIKRIAFSKGNYATGDIESIISRVAVAYDNSGASDYYDGKTFNND